jgi:hypothetical protein
VKREGVPLVVVEGAQFFFTSVIKNICKCRHSHYVHQKFLELPSFLGLLIDLSNLFDLARACGHFFKVQHFSKL